LSLARSLIEQLLACFRHKQPEYLVDLTATLKSGSARRCCYHSRGDEAER